MTDPYPELLGPSPAILPQAVASVDPELAELIALEQQERGDG